LAQTQGRQRIRIAEQAQALAWQPIRIVLNSDDTDLALVLRLMRTSLQSASSDIQRALTSAAYAPGTRFSDAGTHAPDHGRCHQPGWEIGSVVCERLLNPSEQGELILWDLTTEK